MRMASEPDFSRSSPPPRTSFSVDGFVVVCEWVVVVVAVPQQTSDHCPRHVGAGARVAGGRATCRCFYFTYTNRCGVARLPHPVPRRAVGGWRRDGGSTEGRQSAHKRPAHRRAGRVHGVVGEAGMDWACVVALDDSVPHLPTLWLHRKVCGCGVGVTVVMGWACRAGWTATASRTHRGLAGAGEQVVNENEVDKSKSKLNDVKVANRCMPCLAPVAVMGSRLSCRRERGGHPRVSHPHRYRSRSCGLEGNV